MRAVYLVAILDFVFDDDKPLKQVRHEVQLRNQHGDIFYDKLTFIYLEMPNFTKTEAQLESPYEKWLYLLKHLPNLEQRPRALQERIFQKVFEAAEVARFTPEERRSYEQSLKYYWNWKNVLDTALADGIRQGFEQGVEKGFEQGIEKGIGEGRQEERDSRILKDLRRGKLTPAEIAEDADVAIELVLKIKAEAGL